VIGIVANSGINFPVAQVPEAYIPLDDEHVTGAVLMVHTAGDPNGLRSIVRSATTLDGFPPLVSLLDNNLAQLTFGLRNLLLVISVMGGVAVAIAGSGIFGLIAFTVSRQMHEIGVRLALGADRLRILQTVLGQYVLPVGIGLGLGGVAAAGIAKVLPLQQYPIPRFDSLSYVVALAAFLAVASIAALSPCLKALRTDPATVLRHD
jgi:ABC-type antimicrobial peptide transport system permease subunit